MIVLHVFQVFFNFVAMACFATVANFQAKWKVGPSGLSGFALFVSVTSIFLGLFVSWGELGHRTRGVLSVGGIVSNLLAALITTISVGTQSGCKNPENDPHAGDRDDGFKDGLPHWCKTKWAGAVFFWLAFIFWTVIAIYHWGHRRSSWPRYPSFGSPVNIVHPDPPRRADPPLTRPAKVQRADPPLTRPAGVGDQHNADNRPVTVVRTEYTVATTVRRWVVSAISSG